MEFVTLILFVAVFIYLTITVTVFYQTKCLTKMTLEPIESIKRFKRQLKKVQPTVTWALEKDFIFLGYFSSKIGSQKVFTAAWQFPSRPTYLCQFIVSNQNKTVSVIDMATEFADDVCLTTGSSKDGNLFPKRPCSYHQSFSKISLNDQWARHLQTENLLMDHGGAQLVAKDIQFEEMMVQSVRDEANFIQSIPFWAFRGAYWYFVRRNVWHNKSVKTQHEKGLIKLPNELTDTDISVLSCK